MTVSVENNYDGSRIFYWLADIIEVPVDQVTISSPSAKPRVSALAFIYGSTVQKEGVSIELRLRQIRQNLALIKRIVPLFAIQLATSSYCVCDTFRRSWRLRFSLLDRGRLAACRAVNAAIFQLYVNTVALKHASNVDSWGIHGKKEELINFKCNTFFVCFCVCSLSLVILYCELKCFLRFIIKNNLGSDKNEG